MSSLEALNVDQITKVTAGSILGLVVIGLLLLLVISALVGRLIVIIVVVGLGIALWLQRDHVTNEISKDKCHLSATFFGFHLDAPQSVVQACKQHT